MAKLKKTLQEKAFERRENLFLQKLIPENKLCTKCNINKHYTEFNVKFRGKFNTFKLDSSCKECAMKVNMAKINGLSEELKNIKKQRIKDWYSNNKEQVRLRNVLKLYKLTIEEYNNLALQADGCCPICNKHEKDLPKRLAVDHNHETGEVRGLLCTNCNLALGLLFDNTESLKRAIIYLNSRK